MCGIAGVVDLDGERRLHDDALARMLDSLRLRGPDQHGTSVRTPVAMGIRRLSIIDLETGDQPIANEDGTIHVVLNGELYSYRELRETLLGLGHRFRTNSDTEVLVHGYESWGFEGLLERIDGMYAFALHDERSGMLYLARDRMGIKPLVYAHRGGALYFASTIAALQASGDVPIAPDPLGIRLYLRQQFVSGPTTVAAGVSALPPASYISVHDGRVVGPTRYWKPPAVRDDRRSASEWHEVLRTLMDDAVAKRLRADVPVGVFLSGGLDSSIVLALMARHTAHPVDAFHVRFSGETAFDESRFARTAAERFGANLHSIDLDPGRFANGIEDAVGQLNQPLGDPACIPMFCLSREARRHVKVVLAGEGADELFSGYGYYRRVATRWARVVRYAKRLKGGGSGTASSGYPYVMPASDVDALTPAFAGTPDLGSVLRDIECRWMEDGRSDPINDAARIDMGSWLVDDLLMKLDGTSMAYSLEARVPFLDHRVVEAAVTVPGRMKRRGKMGKIILRDAFSEMLGPRLTARAKHGFSVPLASWFRGPLRPLLEHLTQRLPDVPWLDRRVVERIITDHLAGRDRSRVLWTLYVLATWYRAVQSSPRPTELARHGPPSSI